MSYRLVANNKSESEGQNTELNKRKAGSAYGAAGVHIDAAARAKELMQQAVQRTFGPEVLTELGGFSGLFALDLGRTRQPVLVGSMDGVGTKLKIAFALDRHHTVGADLVAHCVNDILTCGARPLFFLDYLAVGEMRPEQVAAIVGGVAEGCRATGCALLGGETAEMPGFYDPGEYDLAGCIVGLVERDEIIDGCAISEGDALIGLPSLGLHTNGYSLARKVISFARLDLHTVVPELGRSLGDELLQPHRCYAPAIHALRQEITIKGMAHITGGGLLDNLPRVLPGGLAARLDARTWEILPIFWLIQRTGHVDWQEMARVFNLGVGYIVVCSAADAERALQLVPEARRVGDVIARGDGSGVVVEGLPE
ncbi:MAG TPA: phosphoribosylformylglycinamidine cyclo-ligase [Ktedonobacterales bacterium]|nr:phosphoribosylformylglycinamidine cyclo-ligase [Ktedonobacterales bacterium]